MKQCKNLPKFDNILLKRVEALTWLAYCANQFPGVTFSKEHVLSASQSTVLTKDKAQISMAILALRYIKRSLEQY